MPTWQARVCQLYIPFSYCLCSWQVELSYRSPEMQSSQIINLLCFNTRCPIHRLDSLHQKEARGFCLYRGWTASTPRSSGQSGLDRARAGASAGAALWLNPGLHRDTLDYLLLCSPVPKLPAWGVKEGGREKIIRMKEEERE